MAELVAFSLRQLSSGLGSKPTHRAIFRVRNDEVIIYGIRHLPQAIFCGSKSITLANNRSPAFASLLEPFSSCTSCQKSTAAVCQTVKPTFPNGCRPSTRNGTSSYRT
jgi:hypothetical protein